MSKIENLINMLKEEWGQPREAVHHGQNAHFYCHAASPLNQLKLMALTGYH